LTKSQLYRYNTYTVEAITQYNSSPKPPQHRTTKNPKINERAWRDKG